GSDPDDVIYAYDDPQSGVSAGGDDEPFVGPSTSSVMPAPDPVSHTLTTPDLLGADIANQKNYGDALHKDIASRWSYILANGGTATHSTSGRAAVGPCTTPTAEEPTATSGNITGTQLDQQHAATGKEAILGSQSSPPISRDAYPGGSQIIREVLIKRGVPQTSLRILMASFANATLKQYSSSIKSWWVFCKDNNFDVYATDCAKIVSLLTKKIEEGSSYSTFNTHRSALSVILGHNIAINNNINRILKGVFRLTPPKPKYNTTWERGIAIPF
ncbi:hypothetical protein evm_014200, partial [Chilo suppressalis]